MHQSRMFQVFEGGWTVREKAVFPFNEHFFYACSKCSLYLQLNIQF